jgi:hypothetical protein
MLHWKVIGLLIIWLLTTDYWLFDYLLLCIDQPLALKLLLPTNYCPTAN